MLLMNRLNYLFKPQSIAVIGASYKDDANSKPILKNLIGSDFNGVVYPVSKSLKSVRGVKTYRSILDVPEAVHLAIIDAEVEELEQIIDDCNPFGARESTAPSACAFAVNLLKEGTAHLL